MPMSKEKAEIRESIFDFERRIEEMHLGFQKYRQGEETKLPDWETLDRELLLFSRRRITDLELSKQLDRIMYKFQNRKKIWLDWVEEYHHGQKV